MTLKFLCVSLAVLSCAAPKSAADDAAEVSRFADRACALGALMPEAPKQRELMRLCAMHANAKEIARAYADAEAE